MLIPNYLPSKHDIYTYDPQAIYTPMGQDPCPCCCDGVPVGFNPQCHGAALNLTGVSLRNRSFARRYTGSTPVGTPYQESNINFYNTQVPCCVLITPKHALITQHYRGTNPEPNPGENYTFLGKSGQKYNRLVSRVTLGVGPDHTLLEFNEPFPTNDVKVYSKIANIQYIPTGHDFWGYECQGRCVRFKMNVATWWPQSNPPIDPNSFTLTYGPAGGIDSYPYIWNGDSGTPAFVLDKYKDTILVGLMYGGAIISPTELNTLNNIISTSGYSISHVKISARASDFNQDGNVDGNDLGFLLGSYDLDNSIADLNFDGKVDGADLGILMTEYGSYTIPPNATRPPT
jgi:hypothetical protein